MIAFEEILIDEPADSWLEKETEFGWKWSERYSMIEAKRDRAAIANLVGLFWENVQELFGKETAKNIYDYFNEVEYTLPSSMYCDALIHCQLVNFPHMSNEEKLLNPEIHTALEDYYWKCLWIITPNMFERFDIDEIMLKYDLTTDAATLIDTRTIKNAYASLMWDHSDTLTKLFGIDVSDIWLTGGMDLENDWPAIRYYYGYVGFAAYAAFILYFVYLIIRRLCRDFKGSFTADNFILLVTFALLIGLAQYSGAVLRRPNVSIYLALVLGLIHYQTAVNPGSRITSWRGEWI